LAILNSSASKVSNTLVVGAQTKNIAITGLNAVDSTNSGVNNNSSVANVVAFGGYNEVYRMSGALGAARCAPELTSILYLIAVMLPDPIDCVPIRKA
jgi:hypothetical protein